MYICIYVCIHIHCIFTYGFIYVRTLSPGYFCGYTQLVCGYVGPICRYINHFCGYFNRLFGSSIAFAILPPLDSEIYRVFGSVSESPL